MKRYIRLTLLSLLVLLGLLQFVRPTRNLSNNNSKDISQVFAIPPAVQTSLKTACYDCHSNYTDYPWYTNIQPAGLWMNDHVEEGKHHLNFSDYAGYNLRRKFHTLEEIGEQVHEGEMPLSSYTLIHRDAMLSEAQKTAITEWAGAMQDSMKAHYPMDSLMRKR